MTKRKNLVITGLADEYRQSFLDIADTMELSRDQLLILLLAGANIVDGGLNAVIPNWDGRIEWRDLMERRFFELACAI